MRMSRLLARTLREVPADAEAASHQLLARAGYVRRLASGIFTFLPLGQRVLANVAAIVGDELTAAGAQEVMLPILQPAELWERTGRLATMADVLFPVRGAGGRFVLAPTAEEAVTAVVGGEVASYRDLPVTVFQIQPKYRDEARPRFGLLRGREFLMADAYSFDASADGMAGSYRLMYDAFARALSRCGLRAVPVEAAAGAIGGDVNHEFMVPSAIGEDTFVRCAACGYAANTEAATAAPPEPGGGPPAPALEEHHTPRRPGIDLVVEHFADRGLTAAGMLKCLALKDPEGGVVVAVVPGDREVRLEEGMVPFTDADFDAHPELVKGYIGPMGLQAHGVQVVADPAVARPQPWVTGANRPDHHVSGAVLGRDFQVDRWAPIATVAAGDPCPRCRAPLAVDRAVEAAHTFQLGLTYSARMPEATFLAPDGSEQPLWMGCYGIGVSRLVAVIAEEHHDGDGLVWPSEVAPYQVHLLAVGGSRAPAVVEAADRLHDDLVAAGVAVLYDDRDASPGVKFADADLLGMPTQLIVGTKGLSRAVVERKDRRTGGRDEVPLEGAAAAVAGSRGRPDQGSAGTRLWPG